MIVQSFQLRQRKALHRAFYSSHKLLAPILF